MVLGQGEWLVSGEEKKILRLPLPPIFKIPVKILLLLLLFCLKIGPLIFFFFFVNLIFLIFLDFFENEQYQHRVDEENQ